MTHVLCSCAMKYELGAPGSFMFSSCPCSGLFADAWRSVASELHGNLVQTRVSFVQSKVSGSQGPRFWTSGGNMLAD